MSWQHLNQPQGWIGVILLSLSLSAPRHSRFSAPPASPPRGSLLIPPPRISASLPPPPFSASPWQPCPPPPGPPAAPSTALFRVSDGHNPYPIQPSTGTRRPRVMTYFLWIYGACAAMSAVGSLVYTGGLNSKPGDRWPSARALAKRGPPAGGLQWLSQRDHWRRGPPGAAAAPRAWQPVRRPPAAGTRPSAQDRATCGSRPAAFLTGARLASGKGVRNGNCACCRPRTGACRDTGLGWAPVVSRPPCDVSCG